MTVRTIVRHGRRIEVETINGPPPKRRRGNQFIGCPIDWLKRVYPLVHGKGEIVVALWLYRRHTVCGGKPFTVANAELSWDFGITRQTKYRTLRRLEKAGAITLQRKGAKTVLVKLL